VVTFEAVSAAGTHLMDLPLVAGDPDASADEFVGAVTLPLDKFRVYAHGTDASGNAVTRAFPVLFGVQTVRVRPVADGVRLASGVSTPVDFDVTNLGPAATFAITAADDARFVTGVSSSTLTLPAGGVGRVTVNMFAPASTTVEFDTLTLVARSLSDPAVSNSARIGVAVGTRDQDGDGVPDDTDQCVASDTSTTIVLDGIESGVPNKMVGTTGCFMRDLIGRAAADARNHGDFVSDVALLGNAWVKSGLLTQDGKGALQRTAARARIP
jgi:hypothetical protein